MSAPACPGAPVSTRMRPSGVTSARTLVPPVVRSDRRGLSAVTPGCCAAARRGHASPVAAVANAPSAPARSSRRRISTGSMRQNQMVRRPDGGDMRRVSITNVLLGAGLALILASATGSAQWLRYPTDGLPRTADGKFNAAAPAPKLPDGKPDLSGLWHAAQARQCTNAAGQPAPCGIELGGSPLGG